MKRSYTENELVNAIKTSTSIRQVLFKLELKQAGGNYQTVRSVIKKLGLDISHFTGKGWSKNKQLPIKRPLVDYLSNYQPIQSYKLKNRLIREGIFDKRCSGCNNTHWLGQPISLELDHIDGNSNNNNLSNLRLLCPNCHAQTSTYRGKNIGNYS